MKLEEIKELVLLLEQSVLTELKVQTEDFKLTLRKGAAQPVPPTTQETASVESRPIAVQQVVVKTVDQEMVSVNSPMVGTFYQAPSPDSEPFAKVGDTVSQGQILCIIEAMKLMNEIKSEYDGTVVEVAVENDQAVEYNQVLFWIKRS